MSEIIEKAMRVMLCNARQCWEQGIAACAAAELGQDELLVAMCNDIVTRQNADGRLCDVECTPASTDSALSIRPVLRAGLLTGDPRFGQAADKNVRYLIERAPRNADGVLYHLLGSREIWADSACMTPANLAHAGFEAFGVKQMNGILRVLHRQDGLYAHKWDDASGAFLRRDAWAAGNGWIAVGLSWLIAELGRDSAEAVRMMERYTALSDAMERYRTEDGLFHNVLDDSDSFVDCEAAAMLAFSAVRLAEAGWLGNESVDQAEKTFGALVEHMDSYGYICDCAGSPRFETPGKSTEMQAFFLMLYAALKRCGRLGGWNQFCDGGKERETIRLCSGE